jgi:2-dehydropantoate 2-reductase
MTEVEVVAAKMGIEMPISIDQRIAGAEKVGEHKTSMLQDLEAGRPMELEALVGAVVELGERLGVPMPYTRTVYACTRLLGTISSPSEAVK